MGAVGVKVSTGIFTGMRGYAYSRNPYIVTGIGVVRSLIRLPATAPKAVLMACTVSG